MPCSVTLGLPCCFTIRFLFTIHNVLFLNVFFFGMLESPENQDFLKIRKKMPKCKNKTETTEI